MPSVRGADIPVRILLRTLHSRMAKGFAQLRPSILKPVQVRCGTERLELCGPGSTFSRSSSPTARAGAIGGDATLPHADGAVAGALAGTSFRHEASGVREVRKRRGREAADVLREVGVTDRPEGVGHPPTPVFLATRCA